MMHMHAVSSPTRPKSPSWEKGTQTRAPCTGHTTVRQATDALRDSHGGYALACLRRVLPRLISAFGGFLGLKSRALPAPASRAHLVASPRHSRRVAAPTTRCDLLTNRAPRRSSRCARAHTCMFNVLQCSTARLMSPHRREDPKRSLPARGTPPCARPQMPYAMNMVAKP